MPKRGRNRVAWIRSALSPHLTQVDNHGYPFKVGDTVIGITSGNQYEIIKNPNGLGYRCRRKRDGHLSPLNVARDGRLHFKHRDERIHLVKQIRDANEATMREARDAKLAEIKKRARKVPSMRKYEHHA